jgi:hypothetical protein
LWNQEKKKSSSSIVAQPAATSADTPQYFLHFEDGPSLVFLAQLLQAADSSDTGRRKSTTVTLNTGYAPYGGSCSDSITRLNASLTR